MSKMPFVFSGDPLIACAFYDSNTGKIFVLIDNNSNFFGISPNDRIAELVIHELMHAVVHEKPAFMANLFNDELTKFYGLYFGKYFGSTLSDVDMKKMITQMFFKFELKDFNMKQLYDFYYNNLKKRTKIKDSLLRRSVELVILAFYYSMTQNPKLAEYKFYKLNDFFKYVYKKALDVDTGDKANFQEICIPSEVIASISHKRDLSSKVDRAILSLK